MNRGSTLSSAAVAVTDAAILNTLFLIFSVVQTDQPIQPGALPWVIIAALLSTANRIFLRRNRTLPSVVVLNAVGFGVLVTALLFGIGRGAGLATVFFTVVFSLVSVAGISHRALRPTTLQQLINKLDIFLMCAAFYVLITARGGFPSWYPLFLFCVLALDMGALAFLRAHGGDGFVRCASRLEGGLVFVASYGLVGALMLLSAFLFSTGARDVAGCLAATVVTALRALWQAVLFLFGVLVSLLPAEEFDMSGDWAMQGGAMEGPPISEALELDPSRLIVLAVIIAALIFAALIWLVFRLRRKRLGYVSEVHRAPSIRASKVRGALRRSFASFRAAVLLRLKAWYYRNTPPGVLLYAERWGRRHGLARVRGETQRAYLTRLANAPDISDEALPGMLLQLAGALDERYFAASPVSPCLAARELRHIRSSLRDCGNSS